MTKSKSSRKPVMPAITLTAEQQQKLQAGFDNLKLFYKKRVHVEGNPGAITRVRGDSLNELIMNAILLANAGFSLNDSPAEYSPGHYAYCYMEKPETAQADDLKALCEDFEFNFRMDALCDREAAVAAQVERIFAEARAAEQARIDAAEVAEKAAIRAAVVAEFGG